LNTKHVLALSLIKAEISNLNDQLKKAKAKKQETEYLIMQDLAVDGSSLSCTEFGTVSVTSKVVPSVTNWPEFEKYIYDNHALHLLQRRPASDSYRDEVKVNGNVPGVESFEVTTLNYSIKKSI